MTERELTKQLKSLRVIEPDAGYARTSRYLIVSQDTIAGQPLKQGALSRGLSFAFSVALTAVFFVVLTFGGLTGYFKTLFMPSLEGVSNEGLITEADTITNDIDIRLEEIKYFENSVAFADVSAPTEGMPGSEDEIDKLLDEVISY